MSIPGTSCPAKSEIEETFSQVVPGLKNPKLVEAACNLSAEISLTAISTTDEADAEGVQYTTHKRIDVCLGDRRLAIIDVITWEDLVEANFLVFHGYPQSGQLDADPLATARLHEDRPGGLEVNAGIRDLHLKCLNELLKNKDVFKEFDDDYPVVCAGFGLGGALATLFLMEVLLARKRQSPMDAEMFLKLDYYALTFGTPMVVSKSGNEVDPVLEVMKDATERKAANFVFANDLCARMPGNFAYIEKHVTKKVAKANNNTFDVYADLLEKIVSDGGKKYLEGKKKSMSAYTHTSALVHIFSNRAKVENGGLPFDEAHAQTTASASVVVDHDLITIKQAITNLANPEVAGRDDQNTIARLAYEDPWLVTKIKRWLLRQKVDDTELHFVIHQPGLSRMSALAQPLAKTAIVTFNGNSTNGKSYLVSSLSSGDGGKPTYVAAPEGATSGDVTMWAWGDSGCGWLMDCEGTNGTKLPIVMSDSYKKTTAKKKVDLTHRCNAVKRCMPCFSLLTCNVFCYVITEGPANVTAYLEVKEFAQNAFAYVENAVPPSLVVIQNKVGWKDCKVSTEKLTGIFNAHSDSDDKKPSLKDLFLEVVFFTVPASDEEVEVRSMGKTMAQIFDDKMLTLNTTLLDLIRKQHEEQEKHDVTVTQARWLKLVDRVAKSVEAGKPVNISHVITTIDVEDEDPEFLSDVWKAFAFLLSDDAFKYKDVQEMIKYVKEVLKVTEIHAATLMAGTKFGSMKDVCEKTMRDQFETEWNYVFGQLEKNIPCCAHTNSGPEGVCGQPKRGHSGHCSRLKRKVTRNTKIPKLFASTLMVSDRWTGGHVADEGIQAMLLNMKDNIFQKAFEIWKVINQGETSRPSTAPTGGGSSSGSFGPQDNSPASHSGGTGISGGAGIGNLRIWWKQQTLSASKIKKCMRNSKVPSLNACYVCATRLEQPGFWDWDRIENLWTAKPGIDLCPACEIALESMIAATKSENMFARWTNSALASSA